MFAGIDGACNRHLLARVDETGQPLGRPIGIDEDTRGCRVVLGAFGPPPILVVMEATGHYWKNLYATLAAAGHDAVPLNPTVARRFQHAGLARLRTDASDGMALARFAFEKRPAPSYLHNAACKSLRDLVRHGDRLKQDFEDRVRQLHCLVDRGSPEFTRYVRGMDTMLATKLHPECPTAAAFARTQPRRLAKLGLRRAQQDRRGSGRAAGRGGQALGRPASRAGP